MRLNARILGNAGMAGGMACTRVVGRRDGGGISEKKRNETPFARREERLRGG